MIVVKNLIYSGGRYAKGTAALPGIAIGKAYVYITKQTSTEKIRITTKQVGQEIKELEKVIEESRQ